MRPYNKMLRSANMLLWLSQYQCLVQAAIPYRFGHFSRSRAGRFRAGTTALAAQINRTLFPVSLGHNFPVFVMHA